MRDSSKEEFEINGFSGGAFQWNEHFFPIKPIPTITRNTNFYWPNGNNRCHRQISRHFINLTLQRLHNIKHSNNMEQNISLTFVGTSTVWMYVFLCDVFRFTGFVFLISNRFYTSKGYIVSLWHMFVNFVVQFVTGHSKKNTLHRIIISR